MPHPQTTITVYSVGIGKREDSDKTKLDSISWIKTGCKSTEITFHSTDSSIISQM